MTDLRYNKFKKIHLSLNEGEEFCKTCDGDGMVKSTKAYLGLIKKGGLLLCKDCMGDGKIDWVEKATGKRRKVNESGSGIRIKF